MIHKVLSRTCALSGSATLCKIMEMRLRVKANATLEPTRKWKVRNIIECVANSFLLVEDHLMPRKTRKNKAGRRSKTSQALIPVPWQIEMNSIFLHTKLLSMCPWLGLSSVKELSNILNWLSAPSSIPFSLWLLFKTLLTSFSTPANTSSAMSPMMLPDKRNQIKWENCLIRLVRLTTVLSSVTVGNRN